jgi:hypothetical protein
MGVPSAGPLNLSDNDIAIAPTGGFRINSLARLTGFVLQYFRRNSRGGCDAPFTGPQYRGSRGMKRISGELVLRYLIVTEAHSSSIGHPSVEAPVGSEVVSQGKTKDET